MAARRSRHLHRPHPGPATATRCSAMTAALAAVASISLGRPGSAGHPGHPARRSSIPAPPIRWSPCSRAWCSAAPATIVKQVGKPLAGKTGTTNDSKDTWFVGFSPDLTVGVYIGFDNPRNLGDKETGGGLAAPIFRDFMLEALADSRRRRSACRPASAWCASISRPASGASGTGHDLRGLQARHRAERPGRRHRRLGRHVRHRRRGRNHRQRHHDDRPHRDRRLVLTPG